MNIRDFIKRYGRFPMPNGTATDKFLLIARNHWVTNLSRCVRLYGLDQLDAVAMLNQELALSKINPEGQMYFTGKFNWGCEHLSYPENFPLNLYKFAHEFETRCGGIRTSKWCPPVYAKLWLCCIVLGRMYYPFSFARNVFAAASKGFENFGTGSIQQFVATAKRYGFLAEAKKGAKFGSPSTFYLANENDTSLFHYYLFVGRKQKCGYEKTLAGMFLNRFPDLQETIRKEFESCSFTEDNTKAIQEYLNSTYSINRYK